MLRSSRSNLEGEECDKISNTTHKTTHQTNSNTSSSHCSLAFTPSSTTTVSSSQGTQACTSSSELYQPRPVLINKQKHKEKQDEGCYSSKMVVCLPLISLVALILWGKFCAILCTLIGFFLVHPQRKRNRALSVDTKFDSVQYKKKIIMEGLHQRRRNSHIARST
ncbi:hypothetical protein Lal_00019899 [Lupinus albus]|nr:hypothetical protein Lal_00019899 [Lupinus albus]